MRPTKNFDISGNELAKETIIIFSELNIGMKLTKMILTILLKNI